MIVHVVIPTYKPKEELAKLLRALRKQTIQPDQIWIINTDRRFFHQSAYQSIADYKLVHIKPSEFDHAATRDYGMRLCQEADYVLMMTQDAIPANACLIENLLKGMKAQGPMGEQVAVSYARQLPKKGCSSKERYLRNLSYPKESKIKTMADESKLGIQTYFCSDVCAMYDRPTYSQTGGFVNQAIFNEDMLYAYQAISQGYAVHYVADAKVVHSHDYTYAKQFTRHFDMGVSQKEHPELYARVSSESEGVSRVIKTANYLIHEGEWYQIPDLIGNTAARYAGYFLGKHYEPLGKKLCRQLSANKEYWK